MRVLATFLALFLYGVIILYISACFPFFLVFRFVCFFSSSNSYLTLQICVLMYSQPHYYLVIHASHIICAAQILPSYNLDAFTSILQYVRWIYLWDFQAYDMCAICSSHSLPLSLFKLNPPPTSTLPFSQWCLPHAMRRMVFVFTSFVLRKCPITQQQHKQIHIIIDWSECTWLYAFNTVTNPNNNSRMKMHLLLQCIYDTT